MRIVAALLLLMGASLSWSQETLDKQPLTFSNEQVKAYRIHLLRDRSLTMPAAKHGYFLITLEEGLLGFAKDGEYPAFNTPLAPAHGRFLFAGRAQSIVNRDSRPYEGLLLEFLDPDVNTWGYQAINKKQSGWTWGPETFPVPVFPAATFVNTLRLNKVLALDVQLQPRDRLPGGKGPGWLMVAVNDVDLSSKEPVKLQAGEVRWFPAGDRAEYINQSRETVRFLIFNFGTEVTMENVPKVMR